ncbi:MAG: hypothetical protein HY053_03705, partial [Proteobacteria bacterium]|nr:hypothetical protein [Pseudomonadota bacterium]
MARVFCIPLFLALFLLTMKILVAPSLAWAETADANMPLWKSIRDFEDKHAFEIYGPPLPQNAAKAQAETRLYEDMVLYFDETAEDEPDFIFVAEAFSVPVEIFRPEIIRPGEAKKIKDDPFGEDDPLPEAVQSTSAYVDEIRPTFLPGGPLKQRDPKQVVLGEEKAGSLFAESDRLKEEAKAAEKTAESKPAETAAKPPDTESILVGPAKKKEPAVGSNEETLMALKKAV